MRQYALKRIGLFIPTVLLITLIIFVVMRVIPGDPALAILNDGDAEYTQAMFGMKSNKELSTPKRKRPSKRDLSTLVELMKPRLSALVIDLSLSRRRSAILRQR